MGKEILLVVNSVSHEKNVPADVIFEAIELALATVIKKRYKMDVHIKVSIDRKTGDYNTFRCWELVEDNLFDNDQLQMKMSDLKETDQQLTCGDFFDEHIPSIEFGRIAAQTAKQVIVQKVREAERRQMVESYRSQLGKLITGTVKKSIKEGYLIDLGNNSEAILKKEDMIPKEVLRTGTRVRALLLEISEIGRFPQLLLSRICSEMLFELFALEVPEISEEIIEIKGISRDPGSRAKIAVKTNDGRIDPVGACVGMRGARVQAVSSELQNERIDIVLWDENPAQFVINSMQPAEVASIIVDEDKKTMDVAVDDGNLAQAIGRGGQNVRLASELTGWLLNVMTEAEAKTKQETEDEGHCEMLKKLLHLDSELAINLVKGGISSLEEMAYLPQDELLEIEELNIELIQSLQEKAKKALLLVKPEEDKAITETDSSQYTLFSIESMTVELADLLRKNGITTLQLLAESSRDDLAEIQELDAEQTADLIMKARNICWFDEAN
ncbi:MAG: transcription termination/antitermination protein NusA [Endozoicomonadaceae bacterium]|nr:transcription termination/antitermination protein NusA [Endozoicomonadaceae bacterium]